MKLVIAPNGNLQIDEARIIYKNFEGRGDKYNRKGDRNFAVVIPNEEIADLLVNDKNDWGKGWNVHIKPAREEGEPPFMYLPVKVNFNGRGPKIYLRSGRARRLLTEETVDILDNVDIDHVDLDIRPYDGDGAGLSGPFRSAYLSAMEVFQIIDRFEERYAEEECPEE
jgi:hypothetical protein